MHHFHNLWSAFGGFAPRPHRAPSLGHFRSQTPNLPTPGKNPAGSHDRVNFRDDSAMMASSQTLSWVGYCCCCFVRPRPT